MAHQSCISAHCSSMTDHDLTCCKEKSSHDYWSWNTANTWVLHYHFWPMTSVKGRFQNIKHWFRFPISRRYLVYEQLGCTREWALKCDEFPKNIISKCPGRINVFFFNHKDIDGIGHLIQCPKLVYKVQQKIDWSQSAEFANDESETKYWFQIQGRSPDIVSLCS